MVLRPFAPPPLRGIHATTASADFSSTLLEEISPGKVQNLFPRAAWLYLMRLDDLWASLFRASLPPAPGLAASSCSYGRRFATRFFQLHLAATPCVSLRLPSSAPIGSFHPTRFCPCWAHPAAGLQTRREASYARQERVLENPRRTGVLPHLSGELRSPPEMCAEHVRQLERESPLPNLMEVKG